MRPYAPTGWRDGTHLGRTTLAIHRLRLHTNGGDDVVAAADVGKEIVRQIARARSNPQMVMRIDDRQIRLEDRLRLSQTDPIRGE